MWSFLCSLGIYQLESLIFSVGLVIVGIVMEVVRCGYGAPSLGCTNFVYGVLLSCGICVLVGLGWKGSLVLVFGVWDWGVIGVVLLLICGFLLFIFSHDILSFYYWFSSGRVHGSTFFVFLSGDGVRAEGGGRRRSGGRWLSVRLVIG